MTGSDYGLPVGLNMFNGMKTDLTLLKNYLGDARNPTGAVYAEIVYDGRVQGLQRTEALWFKLINTGVGMCDLNQPTQATRPSKEDTLLTRAVDIKAILNQALTEVSKYEPIQEQTDVQIRARFPDGTHWQADDREKIRQRRLALRWGLIQDLNKCLTLATVLAAYCKRMGPYLGITPTQKWEDCDLSSYLQKRSIDKEDAGLICSCLGAIRPEHLAHIQATDMLRSSIPAKARTALIKVVDDYRSEHKIKSNVDISLPVGRHPTTLTTSNVHLATFTEVPAVIPSGAKRMGKGINDGSRSSMSAHVDTGAAALACMRAALEAADLGAHGGLETLGARLTVPQPSAGTGLYRGRQFNARHLREARANVGKEVGTAKNDEYTRYLQAYMAFQDQDNVVDRAKRRREVHAGAYSRHAATRPLPALEIEEWPAGAAGGHSGHGGAFDEWDFGAREAAADERASKRRREMRERHRAEMDAERRRETREREAAELERRARDGELPPGRLARVLGMERDWLDY